MHQWPQKEKGIQNSPTKIQNIKIQHTSCFGKASHFDMWKHEKENTGSVNGSARNIKENRYQKNL